MRKRPEEGIEIQERDLALIRGLFESRVMTSAHVAALYFDGRQEAAKKRLQALKTAGYIWTRKGRVNERAALFLSKSGLALLREREILAEYTPLGTSILAKRCSVSNSTILHELEVMDAKIAFHQSINDSRGLSLSEFGTWPRLYQFSTRSSVRGPDGYIRIHERTMGDRISEHCFFLEIDRSTESLGTLAGKANDYLDYYRSGGYAVRNGSERSQFKDHPFRVLMVFRTEARRNNMAERLLRGSPPILTLAFLSTLDEVRNDALGPVWIRPLDYRAATEGTEFDPERHKQTQGRWAARDAFVRGKLERRALFAERLPDDDDRR